MGGGPLGAETIIGAIAATVGVSTAVATVVYYVGATLVMGALSNFAAKKAGEGSPDISQRAITSRGTVDPAKIIYGQAMVGGTLAYRNAHGAKNRELWAVHVLAGHEVEEISDVLLDSKTITNAQINSGAVAGGAVDSGDYGPVRGQTVAAIYKHYGTSTQTANSALVAASTDWTTNHRLRGHAYCVTEWVLWDKVQTLWEAGDPTNVKFLVKGKKIYDPRLDDTQVISKSTSPWTYGSGTHRADDSSTWEWSDNPSLCTADYLMDAKFSPLQGGVPPSRIKWDKVAQAADYCDVEVFIPPSASPSNTEKRFTCNGVVYGTATPESNIAELLSSFNGELIFSDGMYEIHAGEYTAPVHSLNEDHIIGPISIGSALESDERVNTMKAVYVDPDREYEATETAYIELYKDTRDNDLELAKSIELPLTNSWYMAQRIVLLRLQEANQELTVRVPFNMHAARLSPDDRINLTLAERGWADKIFKVQSTQFFDQGDSKLGVYVDLKEDDSTAYGDPDVSDYNTVNNQGALTIADPDPVPSQDTLPRSINVGEGAWNIELVPNSDDGTADSNDGEIYFTAGSYRLPDGTLRTITACVVWTPYEASLTPPDQVAYVVWGATSPLTRFSSSPEYAFSTSSAPFGLFCAIYDRFADQWYAVDNNDEEIAFTPASTDYVVARLIKTSASGGYDTLTSLVPTVLNAEATDGATAGDNLLREDDTTVVDDINFLNDYTNGENLAGDLTGNPYMTRVDAFNDRPWGVKAGYGSTDSTIATYADAARTVLEIEDSNDNGIGVVWPAFPVFEGQKFRIAIRFRYTSIETGARLYVRCLEKSSPLTSGNTHLGYLNGEAGVDTTGSSGSTGVEIIDGGATGWSGSAAAGGLEVDPDLTENTWYEMVLEYTAGSGREWASPCILNWDTSTGASQSSILEIDVFSVQPAATLNEGTLADQDTVGQFDIDLYAAGRVSVASGASSVSVTTAGWKELETVDVTVPATATDSVVMLEVVTSLAGSLLTHGTSQGFTSWQMRILDDDDAVVLSYNMEGGYTRLDVNAASFNYVYMRGERTVNVLVPSADLNAGQTNTFKVEINGQAAFSAWSILGGCELMRATLLNQSEA